MAGNGSKLNARITTKRSTDSASIVDCFIPLDILTIALSVSLIWSDSLETWSDEPKV